MLFIRLIKLINLLTQILNLLTNNFNIYRIVLIKPITRTKYS